jgi:hypothetical protein
MRWDARLRFGIPGNKKKRFPQRLDIVFSERHRREHALCCGLVGIPA